MSHAWSQKPWASTSAAMHSIAMEKWFCMPFPHPSEHRSFPREVIILFISIDSVWHLVGPWANVSQTELPCFQSPAFFKSQCCFPFLNRGSLLQPPPSVTHTYVTSPWRSPLLGMYIVSHSSKSFFFKILFSGRTMYVQYMDIHGCTYMEVREQHRTLCSLLLPAWWAGSSTHWAIWLPPTATLYSTSPSFSSHLCPTLQHSLSWEFIFSALFLLLLLSSHLYTIPTLS